ncbi:hypothetical protein EJ110_NYTH54269 [Nymphaea thermarum]|nr:hypothetical protein EJ110_NYTH54269 [Nymphaea thermarum]
MQRLMQTKFVPSDHVERAYKEYLNLRQSSRSIADYTVEFHRLSLRVQIVETERQQVTRENIEKCGLERFGISLSFITHELIVLLDGGMKSKRVESTKEFIRSLEGYWRILYFKDVAANLETIMGIWGIAPNYNLGLLIKGRKENLLWQRPLYPDKGEECFHSDTSSPSLTIDRNTKALNHLGTSTNITNWGSSIDEQLHDSPAEANM